MTQSTLDAFTKFVDGTDANDNAEYENKNRDEPASGSEWSDNDSNVSADEFFTLSEEQFAQRDAKHMEHADSNVSANEFLTLSEEQPAQRDAEHMEHTDSNVSADEFFTLSEEQLAQRDAEHMEHAETFENLLSDTSKPLI